MVSNRKAVSRDSRESALACQTFAFVVSVLATPPSTTQKSCPGPYSEAKSVRDRDQILRCVAGYQDWALNRADMLNAVGEQLQMLQQLVLGRAEDVDESQARGPKLWLIN